MANLVVCTHDRLAEGFLNSARMIVPTINEDNIKAICFFNGESIDTLVSKIDDAVDDFRKRNEYYLIVADMAGASPFNAALQVAIKDKMHVVGGINLPLLLELMMLPLNFSDSQLEETMQRAGDSIKLINTKNLIL